MIGDTFANDLLKLIFNAVGIANLADNAVTSPYTNLYFTFHNGEVAAGGSQTTNEVTYTGAIRIPIVRTSSGFTVSGRNVVNVAAITGGLCTAGADTITHWSIGTASSGAGKVLVSGTLAKSVEGPFTAVGSTDIFTIPGHTFAVGDRIVFYPSAGSTLPTGITAGTHYFVKTVSGNTVTISATNGGATLDITTDGDGTAYKGDVLAVSVNITPEIAIGQFSFTL